MRKAASRTSLIGGGMLACLSLGGCDDGAPAGPEPTDMAIDMSQLPDGGPPDAGMADATPPDAMLPDAMMGPATPPDGTVLRLAGGSSSGFVDGVGAAARFHGVTCIALSADGARLFASDTFNGMVRAIDLDSGAVTTLTGKPLEFATFDGALDMARFSGPRGCAATADALYVADGPALRRIDLTEQTVSTLAGQADARGNQDGIGADARLGYLTHDIAVSADGAVLYLADRSNDAIRTVDVARAEVTTVVPGGLNGPGGLALTDDALYVADTFDGELLRVDLNDFGVRRVAGGFDAPQGVAVHGQTAWLGGFNGVLHQVDLTTGESAAILGVAGDARPVDGAGDAVRLGGTFAAPVYDAMRGRLYYVDLSSGGIRQIDPEALTVAPLAGPVDPAGYRDGADPRFNTLYDVIWDGAGWIVSDPLNNAVRRIAPDGSASTIFGVPGEAEIRDGATDVARAIAPIGLAWVDDRLYVADYEADAVRIVANGEVTTYGRNGNTGVQGPWGLGAAPDGRVFITELERGAVQVIRPDGSLGRAAAPGTFEAPTDVAVDPRTGSVYVADSERAAIYRLVDGNAELVTGSPGETGVRDGALDQALLAGPTGLSFAPDGGLLVVDGANHLIRRIDLEAGVIERWLGHPTRHGGRAVGATIPWADATLEQPRGVAVGADGALGVVTQYGLTVATPAR